jgi:hypothetical protein
MFLFISGITSIINDYNTLSMRTRVSRGTLVASTNTYRHILSKRLIIEVIYNFRRGIVIERTIDVRQTLNQ